MRAVTLLCDNRYERLHDKVKVTIKNRTPLITSSHKSLALILIARFYNCLSAKIITKFNKSLYHPYHLSIWI